MVDAVGTDQDLFLFSQKTMKNLLSDIVKKKSDLINKKEKGDISDDGVSNEWVSYNLKADNTRSNKKQNYNLSQG